MIITPNSGILGLFCFRCKEEYPIDDFFEGCPKCLSENYPSSLTLLYENDSSSYLPYHFSPASLLGEGNTPISKSERVSEAVNIDELYFKYEFQNPSGSHKDRMSKYAVARAKERGYSVVVGSSSGNAAISLALYANCFDIGCRIYSTHNMSTAYRNALEKLGAELVLTPTEMDRWARAKDDTEAGAFSVTNYTDPPVGSNPFGIQGYKEISYEIHSQIPKTPDYVLAPASRGDLLYGIFEGFTDLLSMNEISRIPKMVAIEPIDRLSKVTEDGQDYRSKFSGDYSETLSIGGRTLTYQSVYALQKSGGFALTVSPRRSQEDISRFGKAGYYLESSSAVVYQALERMSREKDVSNRTVAAVLTSHGFSK